MSEFSKYGRWLSTPPISEKVVISGISGRFPESKNLHELRTNLFNRKDMVTEVELSWSRSNPEILKRNGKIHDTDKFDSGFFGIHHRQAEIMDPAMRKTLEVSVEAAIDAGFNPSELKGTKTGVFCGAILLGDVEVETLSHATKPQNFAATGNFRSFVAHRISYFLRLKGPSYIVDSNCSASSNALELAFKSIRSGACDGAIVVGSNLLQHPSITLQFHRLGTLNEAGICKTFDEDANGYVKGEAVVAVFLQKAKDARRNYGQIIYTEANCDGFKEQGLTYPSSKMQQQLITEVLTDSQISASEICFWEAHGTGTKVGDPAEVTAIDNAIAKKRTKPLLVGSIKSNMGHTEPASGLCSLAKLIIAMETGYIPPNIHLNKTRKDLIGFESGRMKAVTEAIKLNREDGILGFNNFGFGGTNCNILLRRFNKLKVNNGEPQDHLPRLVCASGRTEEAVAALLKFKSLDVEYVGLVHQIFKINFDTHWYRGFTIATKTEKTETYINAYNQKPVNLYVFFGTIRNSYRKIGAHLLPFPHFKKSLEKIQEYLRLIEVDISEELVNKNYNYIELCAFAVGVAIADMLKLLNLNEITLHDNTLSAKLVSAYSKGNITLKEALLIIGKNNTVVSVNQKSEKESYNGLLRFVKSYKNATILHISDEPLRKNVDDLYLSENFLEILGRLYTKGLNPQIHKLYPPIEFPVSRNTPMISPNLKWNYDKNWYTFKFDGFHKSGMFQREYVISSSEAQDQKYLSGHMIDGRNLVPATEYLILVWRTLAKSLRLSKKDVPINFENCKFVKAVIIPRDESVRLTVSIQKGSGDFEVVHKNFVVATGRIRKSQNYENFAKLPNLGLNKDQKDIIEHDELYRQFSLRGYNYKGSFRAIQKCNFDGSAALIRWENNWTTFLDNMLQLAVIQQDTKMLCVPVFIRKVSIRPQTHLKMSQSQKDVCLVYNYKTCNIIKSGAIEILGLQTKSVSKRKTLAEPVLEKYVFVPNDTKITLEQSVRTNIQIILENSLEDNLKAVEIVDSYSISNSVFLSPLIQKAMQDIPLITSDITISSPSTSVDIPNIKLENFTFSTDSNLLLIVGTSLLQRLKYLKQILKSLKHNGFIISRETKHYLPENLEDLEVCTEHTTENEKLILLKRKTESTKTKFIEVKSNVSDWLPILQGALKSGENIVIHSKNPSDGILGFVNCIRREPTGNSVRCLFMIDSVPKFDPKNDFYKNQIEKNMALNVYKYGKWGTYRHLLLEDPSEVRCEHCFLSARNVDGISSMKWIEGPLSTKTTFKDDEILVFPYYSALNFEDVMIATGRVAINSATSDSTSVDRQNLHGIEFSGRDVNGRRVMGMITQGALSTMVAADAKLLWKVPDEWSLEDASTVTVVYSTVIYALFQRVKLKRGSSILIHSATGSIGLAALNVCLYYGCDIYVTVSTKEKGDYLKKHFPQIPESHIGNSRDTSFEEMIKSETKNRGVDVVLNSLSEEKLVASIRCVASGGNLAQIGKFDLENNSTLNMLLMGKNITYHGILVDRIFSNLSQMKNIIFEEIENGIKAGYVKPLPRTSFNRNEVEKAFRYMMVGKHIGKVLIKVRDEKNTTVDDLHLGTPKFNCNPEKSYIIIGGLGGFGLELADWLFLRGVKNLILVSRTGIKSGNQTSKISNWRTNGVTVKVSTHDVTTKQGCIELIKEATQLAPIDGIFNLAAILKAVLFENQTMETFSIPMAPKALATAHLDEVTRKCCPDLKYFVLFSSSSCGRGNPGETNYGMANSVMERICEQRKRDGFPALAIQWGAIGDVGIVAKMQKENKQLVIGGTLQQNIYNCLEVLDTFLNQNNAIVSSMVVAEKEVSSCEGAVGTIAKILGIKDVKTVRPNTTLAELGIDSMVDAEVAQILENNFEIYLTPKEVRQLTVEKLTELEKHKNQQDFDEYKQRKLQFAADFMIQNIPKKEARHLSIVELPGKSSDTEVFVLPGLEGAFQTLEFLSSNLEAKVLGLQYDFDCPENSIQEIAQNILPHIEVNLNNNKLFTLVGYSFGTVVGLELISLLEQKGYKGNLIAIDGSPTYSKALVTRVFPFKSDLELQTMLVHRFMSILLPAKVVKKHEEMLSNCKNLDDSVDLLLNLVSDKEMIEKQIFLTLYKRVKFLVNYKFNHKKIESTVHLIKAKNSMMPDQNDYDLSKFCEKPVQVSTVDGDHVSILQTIEIIDIINKYL